MSSKNELQAQYSFIYLVQYLDKKYIHLKKNLKK